MQEKSNTNLPLDYGIGPHETAWSRPRRWGGDD